MFEIITACPVFKGIEAADLENLFKDIHHFTRSYEPGEMIHLTGEKCLYLLCLIEGSVVGEMVDINGKIIKIEDIAAPRGLAAAFLFGKENKFPVNIISSKKTRLLYIPREEFLKLMQSEQRILINWLNYISSRAQFLSDKIRFLAFKTIRGKLAHYIFNLAREDNDLVELPVSQQAMAELFGVTRPALARVLGELEQENILKVNRRIIRIINREKLKKLFED